MVTLSRPQRLTLPLSTVAAATVGGLVALCFLLIPASLLESAVDASGLPAVMAAAEPPLGATARIALAVMFGGVSASLAWFGAGLVGEGRPVSLDRAAALLRRADIHPDAPPRPPLFAARDLGTPFLDVKAPASEQAPVPSAPLPQPIATPPAERPLPADLDLPLAAFFYNVTTVNHFRH